MTDPTPSIPQQNSEKIGHSTAYLKKRKFLFSAPLVAFPILCALFNGLEGGKDALKKEAPSSKGFNTQLPGARFDKQHKQDTKLDAYQQADADSERRREYLQKDPYQSKGTDTIQKSAPPAASALPEDPRANELLKKLDQLKQLTHPSPLTPSALPSHKIHVPRSIDSEENDPQLEKLNGMLDKIIRIQHPAQPDPSDGATGSNNFMDTSSNSLPGVVAEDQVIVAGATIALRLTTAASINGVILPKDQLVYGVVSISNDRMLIHISSIRNKASIYSTALQVYDMDGLPGIHIPGSLGRETAKQSADQGINGVNITNYDPSLGAQAANAGIQAARTLLSRKVRLVRVTVHGGYQVLLRNTHPNGSIHLMYPDHPLSDSLSVLPKPEDCKPFLHHSTRSEKMEMVLQGIWLNNSRIFISLLLSNRSHLSFTPEYIRWFIRDRRQERRTALQEIPLDPVYVPPLSTLPGDSSVCFLAGFPGFTLPKDKELVLQLADKGGARSLTLTIDHKTILKAQLWEDAKKIQTNALSLSNLRSRPVTSKS